MQQSGDQVATWCYDLNVRLRSGLWVGFFVDHYLLPGLTAGIRARSGGSFSASNVSTFISTRLTNGQPKFVLLASLRSTITPIAETIPPCWRTMSIVS